MYLPSSSSLYCPEYDIGIYKPTRVFVISLLSFLGYCRSRSNNNTSQKQVRKFSYAPIQQPSQNHSTTLAALPRTTVALLPPPPFSPRSNFCRPAPALAGRDPLSVQHCRTLSLDVFIVGPGVANLNKPCWKPPEKTEGGKTRTSVALFVHHPAKQVKNSSQGVRLAIAFQSSL